jgi:hypothetical protein
MTGLESYLGSLQLVRVHETFSTLQYPKQGVLSLRLCMISPKETLKFALRGTEYGHEQTPAFFTTLGEIHKGADRYIT